MVQNLQILPRMNVSASVNSINVKRQWCRLEVWNFRSFKTTAVLIPVKCQLVSTFDRYLDPFGNNVYWEHFYINNLKMSLQPILNPEVPYVGELEGGLVPGKMVKVQGKVPVDATRFAVNYQLGPSLNPRDDIAIHVSPRFSEGFITRNHIESMNWGPEENHGPLLIQPGSSFEIIILCEYQCYKIAINGRHFTEFAHRLPYNKVTHLTIDGEVEITSIFYETIPIGPRPSAPVPDVSSVDVGPPPPGGLYPTLNSQEKYGPPPVSNYGNNPPHAYGYHDQKSEEEDAFGSCLDKVGLAVGGLVAAGGVAAAMHAMNKNKKQHEAEGEHEKSEVSENESGFGGLGALGAALASSLASNSMQGDGRNQSYPSQDSGSGMLGSILGALGGAGGHQQPQSDPLAGALGSILGGGHQQPQSQPDPLRGALDSILGGVLGGGGAGHQQQPQYQPSGGYGSYPQNQGSQAGGGGGDSNDLFSGLGGALLKSALDGISKHAQKSHHGEDNESGQYPGTPSPATPYGSQSGQYPSAPPPSVRPSSPPASGGAKLTAAEISKGLGLGDDED